MAIKKIKEIKKENLNISLFEKDKNIKEVYIYKDNLLKGIIVIDSNNIKIQNQIINSIKENNFKENNFLEKGKKYLDDLKINKAFKYGIASQIIENNENVKSFLNDVLFLKETIVNSNKKNLNKDQS